MAESESCSAGRWAPDGERVGVGVHMRSESVNRIEWGVVKHENGCKLRIQIKRACDVVVSEMVLLLLVSRIRESEPKTSCDG